MTKKTDSKNFPLLREHCDKTSRLTERVFDDFLLSFAMRHQGLEKRMNQIFSKYRQALSLFDMYGTGLLKSQFIAHKVFMKDGLIGKFLKNPNLGRLSQEESNFLEQQASTPWRYSFSKIIGEPQNEFFLMKDVFTEEEYLIFSPSIGGVKNSGNILLWLNLIGFNGMCWQSYGSIGAFHSFDIDDILFFAMEKNPAIEEESEVQKDIENDPLPYMLLLAGANYPRTFHKQDEYIIVMTEHDSEIPDTKSLKKHFVSEYNDNVYCFTHMEIGTPPHFAQIYYDEDKEILLFYALTESGFNRLVRDFNSLGYKIPVKPFLMVRPQMVSVAEKILNRKIVLNEYQELFRKDEDPADTKNIEKMNKFLALVLPDLNAGRKPDIEAAARETGLDTESAFEVVKMIRGKLDGVTLPATSVIMEGNPKKKKGNERKPEQKLNPLITIYLAAKLICDLKPWENLYETDIFGVKMPGSGTTWFISVMGNCGEYTALAAYKGYSGLFGFRSLQRNESGIPDTNLFTIPHLMISFVDREELNKKDIEAIKQSGVGFRGRGQWPKIEEIIPGFAPAFPEGEALEDLPFLLDEVSTTLILIRRNPDILFGRGKGDEQILIRIPVTDSGELIWRNHYEVPDRKKAGVRYDIFFDRHSVEKVLKLRSSKKIIQADLFLLPTPVREPGRKDFFPFVLLLIDKESGRIAGMEMLHPDPDLASLYESLAQRLLESILKLDYRPKKIEFRSDMLYGLVQEPLRKAGCTPIMVESMPLMDEALGSMLNRFMK